MTSSHLQPPGVDLKTTLTRAKFESLNAASFESCLDTVKAVRSPPTSACSPADLSLISA
jgi:molecular chaperone DnaK (HSP70)